MTAEEEAAFDAELAADVAAIPDDHDPLVYYAGIESSLREIFSTPVIGDGLRGDTLIVD